jgi:hypothetical protein
MAKVYLGLYHTEEDDPGKLDDATIAGSRNTFGFWPAMGVGRVAYW